MPWHIGPPPVPLLALADDVVDPEEVVAPPVPLPVAPPGPPLPPVAPLPPPPEVLLVAELKESPPQPEAAAAAAVRTAAPTIRKSPFAMTSPHGASIPELVA